MILSQVGAQALILYITVECGAVKKDIPALF